MKDSENYKSKNVVMSTLHAIFSTWLNREDELCIACNIHEGDIRTALK